MFDEKGDIIKALEDEQNSRASILMHLTSIAEQFDKLVKEGEFEILANFEKQDIKGSYDLGIDLYIVEDVIKERLPVMKMNIKKIFSVKLA